MYHIMVLLNCNYHHYHIALTDNDGLAFDLPLRAPTGVDTRYCDLDGGGIDDGSVAVAQFFWTTVNFR